MTAAPLPILDIDYSPAAYRRIDLTGLDPRALQDQVAQLLSAPDVHVAYGGYRETRKLYSNNPHFGGGGPEPRDIHLGLDLWAPTGTGVRVPLDGRVHSWANRAFRGDYGPVILLEHDFGGQHLLSLYGHLSPWDLQGLVAGMEFRAGDPIGYLGDESVNGGYLPHLHFQLIRDPGDWFGDYPGVCSRAQSAFYFENCPDPAAFLGLP